MEDLDRLTELWSGMRFPAEELAKKVTEFQVVEGRAGEVIGAAALENLERQGRIHSEAFFDFALADYARPLLWDRFQSIAQNYGLLRVWTQEEAPFWTHSGLVRGDQQNLAMLPARWKSLPGRWLTLQLREDIDAVLAADREFALFMQEEKERTARTIQHARTLKLLAALLAIVVFGAVILGAFLLLRPR
jgi:hypothetical protein